MTATALPRRVLGPDLAGHRAELTLSLPRGDGPITGAVLVLHGGRSTGTAVTRWSQLSVLRMEPFARAVRTAAATGGARVVVARLRYRVRGWNGRRRDPVIDARWALGWLREQLGDVPVGLIGHSMGGRTAMAVADAPGVVAVVGLAPWLGQGDPLVDLTGRRILVMHGTADRMTDPQASRRWTEQARRQAASATYVAVPGGKHAMLDQASWWHRLAAEFVVATLATVDATLATVDAATPADGRPARHDGQALGTGRTDVAKLLPEVLAGVPFAQA